MRRDAVIVAWFCGVLSSCTLGLAVVFFSEPGQTLLAVSQGGIALTSGAMAVVYWRLLAQNSSIEPSAKDRG